MRLTKARLSKKTRSSYMCKMNNMSKVKYAYTDVH